MASSEAKASATAGTVARGQDAKQFGNQLSASATIPQPKNQTSIRPAKMGVYDGMRPIGHVEDHGAGTVFAWSYTPDGHVKLGRFEDRRAARVAVERHHGLAGGVR
jgi:hypothetical protein